MSGGYVPPSADALVIRPDGTVGNRFPFDTRKMLRRVEEAFRGRQAEQTPGELWASMPLAVREWVAVRALGSRGLACVPQAWESLDAHTRVRIGAKARDLFGKLV